MIRNLTSARRPGRWLFVAMLTAATSPSHAVDYYFSATGSDLTGSGTIDNPWRSPAMYQSVAKQNGDRFLFRGGDTFNGSITDGGGAIETWSATITSYGTGRATINSGSASAISLTNVGNNWTISDLNLVAGADNVSDGISFFISAPGGRLNGPTLRNLDVSGYASNGIIVGSHDADFPYYSPAATQGWDGVLVDNVNAHHNAGAGVFVWGQTTASNNNVTIRNSTAAYNTSHGLLIGNTNSGVIERSVAHHNGDNVDGVVGIWAYDSNAIVIQYNESYANKTNSVHDGGGFDLDGGVTNSVMQYNYSHDNDGAGFMIGEYDGSLPTTGNVVRFNLSENDGRKNNYGGLLIYNFRDPSKVTDNVFHNNTVFNSTGGGNLVLLGALTGSENLFANNLFVTENDTALVRDVRSDRSSGVQLLNNDYFTSGDGFRVVAGNTTYTSLAAWLNAVTTQERLDSNDDGVIDNDDARIALAIDPGFAGVPGQGTILDDADLLGTLTAYQLMSGSDLANAGLDLTAAPFLISLGGEDYYGVPLPQGTAMAIGASEVVPEPSAAAGLLLAAAGLLRRRRRAL